MEFQLDKDWRLQPIKGATGQTYMGIKETEKCSLNETLLHFLQHCLKKG